jgi:hypothetical protein
MNQRKTKPLVIKITPLLHLFFCDKNIAISAPSLTTSTTGRPPASEVQSYTEPTLGNISIFLIS